MFNVCIFFVLSALLPHFTDGYLHVQPRGTITKVFGETFVSFCNYNGTKANRWSFGDQILEGTTSIPNVLKLEIQDVNFSSQGTYVCSARDDNEEDSVTLLVYKKPDFVNIQRNQTLTFGKTGRILCKVESENETIYEWKLNGISLQASERINITKNEYLEIGNVDEKDEGVYTCVATIISNFITKSYPEDIKVFVTGQTFPPRIPNTESTIVYRTEPKGQTARPTTLSPTRIGLANEETTGPIAYTTEPKGTPGGPNTRTPNAKTTKGIPTVRDGDDPEANSGGEVNRNLSIVLLSIISMLIPTVP